jgi:ABC-type transporter Mla subunit MlaD
MGNKMTTPRFLISFILALALAACFHPDKNKLTILFDRVDNLEIGGKVYTRGFPVGEVTHLALLGDSVLVSLKLNDTINIPVESKFIITPSLLGNSQINIEMSDKTTYLTNKDTASGFYLKKGVFDDLISDSTKRGKIIKAVDKINEGIKELVEPSRNH